MKKSVYSKVKDLNTKYDGYALNAFYKNKNVLNFSPGPTQLPNNVINEIKSDIFLDNSIYTYGATPLEISHRSPEFSKILTNVNNDMKKFLKIPDDFSILWTQGGGHGQFSAVPLNFNNMNNNKKCNYVVTGTWSDRSFKESKKFSNSYNSYNHLQKNILPLKLDNIEEYPIINENDKYVYICSNETVNGIEFRNDGIPYPCREQLKDSKLVVDMSSDMGMKNINWKDVDVAFCCTSKNFGVAGANISIVRNNILEMTKNVNNKIPCTLDWNLYKCSNSLYNTPAIFNIYIIEKILKYYLSIGGIDEIEKQSKEKSKLVYNMLDNSKLFHPIVLNKKIRSNINIPFIIGDGSSELRSMFLDFCYKNNIVGLRTQTPFNYSDFNMIEPLRISLYNGISVEDTKELVNIMNIFESNYQKNNF